MASYVLFPPLVNSYEPAFVAGPNSSLKVYFSLNNLSSISGNLASNYRMHAQILRQDGIKVVNTSYEEGAGGIDCSTGTILNLKINPVIGKDNYYYVEIKNNYLKSKVDFSNENGIETYKGWIPGWVYKIQLRLSQNIYSEGQGRPEEWMQKNSSNFSEWSTICYTKAISKMVIKVPMFDYSSALTVGNNKDVVYTISNPTVFFGSIESSIFESNEDFKYVKISLYSKLDEELLDESKEIYKLEQSNTYFEYKFKVNFENKKEYYIVFDYITENDYSPNEKIIFDFIVDNLAIEDIDAELIAVDTTAFPDKFKNLTSKDIEEEEGRIALKIYSPVNDEWSGNICIRRASQDDEFSRWEDIKIITVIKQNLNNLGLIYDYTIESGRWYKYGLQTISKNGEYGVLKEMNTPIHRLFNNSFLLGQGERQLKLQYDTVINSYKHQIYDTKTDTIGSKYPFMSRNADVNYRTFTLSTTVTFNMDEHEDEDAEKYTFLRGDGLQGKNYIYKKKSITKLYNDYLTEEEEKRRGYLHRRQYDFTYERDFRNLVLNFLQDGKPKLFKSPSEGNIIIRLSEVSCTPKQSLDRLIYTISFTANEIDDNTLENYKKYGLYNPGAYATRFKNTTVCIGQIDGKFITKKEIYTHKDEEENGDNIFKKIYEKYDSQGKNTAGYTYTLEDIQRVHITINGYYYKVKDIVVNNLNEIIQEQECPELSYYKPGHQIRLKAKEQVNKENVYILGNNLYLNYTNGSQIITVPDPRGQYEFDSLLKFTYKKIGGNELYFLEGIPDELGNGDLENSKRIGIIDGVDATIDFLYTISSEPYEKHAILKQTAVENIGQFYERVKPGTDIYNIIALRHTAESDTLFRHFLRITSIEIEANPHTIFIIKDATDSSNTTDYFEINDTGILRLYEINNIKKITYVGRRYFETPFDDSTIYNGLRTDSAIKENVYNTEGRYIDYADADVSITYRYVMAEGEYKV